VNERLRTQEEALSKYNAQLESNLAGLQSLSLSQPEDQEPVADVTSEEIDLGVRLTSALQEAIKNSVVAVPEQSESKITFGDGRTEQGSMSFEGNVGVSQPSGTQTYGTSITTGQSKSGRGNWSNEAFQAMFGK
jgi:hypothetical protein